MTLSVEAEDALFAIAETSIRAGARSQAGRVWTPAVETLPEELQKKGACFVTLREHGRLRGCVGTLESTEALGLACARFAFQAAFRDPRFPPVSASELSELEVRLSVITSPVRIPATTTGELLRFLGANRHGVVIEWGGRRGTFLPEVWKELPEPETFLVRLKEKAGIPPEAAPPDLYAFTYKTVTITRPPNAQKFPSL